MPSWTEVRDHLRRTYKLEDDQGSLASMVWRYEDGRSQKIIVRRYRAFEREMIEIKSAFARRDAADPVALLTRNADLPLGTIALTGDVYNVVYNTPVEHLDWGDLELYLTKVAAVADALEAEYGGADAF